MNCSIFSARHPSLICECNLRWWAVEGERLHTAVITGLATAAHFIKQGRRWSRMAVSGIIVWEGVRRKVAGPEQAVSAKACRYAGGVKEQRGVIYQGRLHPWWEISRLARKNRTGLVASTTWNALAFRKRSFSNLKVCHTLQGSDTEMWLIDAALKKEKKKRWIIHGLPHKSAGMCTQKYANINWLVNFPDLMYNNHKKWTMQTHQR